MLLKELNKRISVAAMHVLFLISFSTNITTIIYDIRSGNVIGYDSICISTYLLENIKLVLCDNIRLVKVASSKRHTFSNFVSTQ